MGQTRIEWLMDPYGKQGLTINPVVGCTKISSGCKNCYGEKMAWRLKCMGISKYQDVVDENGWTGKIGVDMSVFDKLPKKHKKIFVCSMGDLFHENVSDDLIESIFAHASSTYYGYHTYMFLTKRIERLKNIKFPQYKNFLLGVTCENQKRYNERWPILEEIPAAVKFVSIEPALEYVNIGVFQSKPNWIIWGPETGPGKRPCDPVWAKKTHKLCKDNDIPFFDKTKDNWIAREFPKEVQNERS